MQYTLPPAWDFLEFLLGGPEIGGLPHGACVGTLRDPGPGIVCPWFHIALGQLLILCPASLHP